MASNERSEAIREFGLQSRNLLVQKRKFYPFSRWVNRKECFWGLVSKVRVWRLDFWCGHISRAISRGGPWKPRLFWAQMALASLVAISDPLLCKWEGGWALEISTFWAPNGTSLTTRCHFRAQKSLDFQDPPLLMALVMDVACIKIIQSRAI